MKIAILITVRLKSTRLPMKVIKPIHGKPMMVHMLDRLKLAQKPTEIIMCTSTVAQDDPLEQIANEQGVKCYRGHPDDVLVRLTTAAKENDVDLVVNCTADNPFVDPIYIDKMIEFHLANQHDFTKVEGLPWGAFAYTINREALEKACSIKDEVDTEVWHGYFMDTGHFRWGKLFVDDPAVKWPDLRVTVDTPEDLAMVTRVFDELYDGRTVFSLEEIVKLCREKPEIPGINSDIIQKAGIPIKVKNDV